LLRVGNVALCQRLDPSDSLGDTGDPTRLLATAGGDRRLGCGGVEALRPQTVEIGSRRSAGRFANAISWLNSSKTIQTMRIGFGLVRNGNAPTWDLILLLYAYPKSVSADLTPKQVAQLAKVVKQEFRDETEDV
jgi:hypothetical protein